MNSGLFSSPGWVMRSGSCISACVTAAAPAALMSFIVRLSIRSVPMLRPALSSVLSRRLMSMNWTWFAEVGTVPVAAPGVATQRFMEWRQDLRQWLAGCS